MVWNGENGYQIKRAIFFICLVGALLLFYKSVTKVESPNVPTVTVDYIQVIVPFLSISVLHFWCHNSGKNPSSD